MDATLQRGFSNEPSRNVYAAFSVLIENSAQYLDPNTLLTLRSVSRQLRETSRTQIRALTATSKSEAAHAACFVNVRRLDLSESRVGQVTDALLLALQPLTALLTLNLSNARQLADPDISHLRKLPKLANLDLSRCRRITGIGFPILDSLPLTSLKLKGCFRLTNGALAAIAATLGRLAALDLSECHQVSAQGCRSLAPLASTLTTLKLKRCKNVTDEGVAALGQLYGLTRLNLSGCARVSGLGLNALSMLTRLRVLDISRCAAAANRVTDNSPGPMALCEAAERLPGSLTELLLCGTGGVTDRFLAALSPRLAQLTTFKLLRCSRATQRGLASVCVALRGVTTLSLNGCQSAVTDEPVLSSLSAHAPLLTDLDLTGCERVSDAGVGLLSTLSCLGALDLTQCHRITDDGIAALGTVTALRSIVLCRCIRLTDASLRTLAALPSVHVVRFSGQHDGITDAGLRHLAALKSLSVLDLRWCGQVTDFGVAALASLPALSSLDLSGCKQVSDVGVAALAVLGSLQEVKLALCPLVTDAGVAQLGQVASLARLDLGGCNVTGSSQVVAGSDVSRQGSAPRCQFVPRSTSAPAQNALLSSTTRQHLGVEHVVDVQPEVVATTPNTGMVTVPAQPTAPYFPSLTTLDLSRCLRLRDDGLDAVAGITSLSSLCLVGCEEVTDLGLQALCSKGAYLTSLDLGRCGQVR
eukprot:gene24428-29702_t